MPLETKILEVITHILDVFSRNSLWIQWFMSVFKSPKRPIQLILEEGSDPVKAFIKSFFELISTYFPFSNASKRVLALAVLEPIVLILK